MGGYLLRLLPLLILLDTLLAAHHVYHVLDGVVHPLQLQQGHVPQLLVGVQQHPRRRVVGVYERPQHGQETQRVGRGIAHLQPRGLGASDPVQLQPAQELAELAAHLFRHGATLLDQLTEGLPDGVDPLAAVAHRVTLLVPTRHGRAPFLQPGRPARGARLLGVAPAVRALPAGVARLVTGSPVAAGSLRLRLPPPAPRPGL